MASRMPKPWIVPSLCPIGCPGDAGECRLVVRLCLNRHEWFSRSERKATSFQLDSFWVEPVGYGLPTGSGLLFERLLPELHRPSRERESGNGGVARRSRALAARESRVPPAGRILEESPPRCLAPHRRVKAGSRTTRGLKALEIGFFRFKVRGLAF